MHEDTSDQLKREIREVEDHQSAAPYRMMAYYRQPQATMFDIAPHDQQLRRGASFLEFTIETFAFQDSQMDLSTDDRDAEWEGRKRWTTWVIEDLLYCIAAELVVSAAHLKLDTKDYLTHLSAQGRTPYVWESVSEVLDDLRTDLDPSTVEEIELVFELTNIRRNNLVHFGFHSSGAHYFPQLVIDVCGFLINRYADTDDIPELETMAEYREKYDRRRIEAELFPELAVGFEPF